MHWWGDRGNVHFSGGAIGLNCRSLDFHFDSQASHGIAYLHVNKYNLPCPLYNRVPARENSPGQDQSRREMGPTSTDRAEFFFPYFLPRVDHWMFSEIDVFSLACPSCTPERALDYLGRLSLSSSRYLLHVVR